MDDACHGKLDDDLREIFQIPNWTVIFDCCTLTRADSQVGQKGVEMRAKLSRKSFHFRLFPTNHRVCKAPRPGGRHTQLAQRIASPHTVDKFPAGPRLPLLFAHTHTHTAYAWIVRDTLITNSRPPPPPTNHQHSTHNAIRDPRLAHHHHNNLPVSRRVTRSAPSVAHTRSFRQLESPLTWPRLLLL